MFKVVLVLDETSKRSIKLDRSVLNSEDVTIVSALNEIMDEHLGEDRHVIVLEGLLHEKNCIGELRLFKDVASFNYVFLISRNENKEYVKSLGTVYQCDNSFITYELLQGSIYNDVSLGVEAKCHDDSKLYAESLLRDSDSEKQLLAKDYLAALQREQKLLKEVTTLQMNMDTLITQNAILSSENKKWYTGFKTLVKRIQQQNNMMLSYETIFTNDVYHKFNLYDYPNKPIIVYLKVFTDFSGINTFVETIVDAFRYQYKQSVKVLQLFDRSGDRHIRLLPKYYHRLRNYYNMPEIIDNDYLCKSGDYTNLLERLLTNKYGLNILIVVDSKDHDDTVFNGTFLQYNLCRTVEQATILGLHQNNTIVNQNVTDWNTWVPTKTSHLTKKQQFVKLSSRKIIQNILEFSDKLSNSF